MQLRNGKIIKPIVNFRPTVSIIEKEPTTLEMANDLVVQLGMNRVELMRCHKVNNYSKLIEEMMEILEVYDLVQTNDRDKLKQLRKIIGHSPNQKITSRDLKKFEKRAQRNRNKERNEAKRMSRIKIVEE